MDPSRPVGASRADAGPRSRRRTGIVVGTVLLVGLLVAVQVLVMSSYRETRRTTAELDASTNATTLTANTQREVLSLALAVERMSGPEDVARVRMRRALLTQQMRVVASERKARKAILVLRVTLIAFDRGLATASRPWSESSRRRLGVILATAEQDIKATFDELEHELYGLLSDTLAARNRTQQRIVAAGGLALLVAIALAGFLRVAVRRDFRRAYEALSAEVEERKMLEEQLLHAAEHDGLTQLGNRARFQRDLQGALASEDPSIGVIFVDLDRFKVVNDSLGHAAGDEVLRQAADRLRDSVRPGDRVARLGGDEFAVLLEGRVDAAGASAIAERLLDKLYAPFVVNGHEVSIGASVGVALNDSASRDPEELVRNADLAMYSVKKDGRGTVRVFDRVLRSAEQGRRELVDELRAAIEADSLTPYYQPIVDLDTGHTVGVEALVRWNHPKRGMVLPGAFLAAAEEAGLVVQLGLGVLRAACRDATNWTAPEGSQAPWVSVNLAPAQLHDPDLPSHVAAVLAETGLPPHRLAVEISERAVLHDAARGSRALDELHRLGVGVALDDFGTGFSSLSYFRFLPIDLLKVDRTLVEGVARDPASRRLAGAILGLARNLGIPAVAEGIEEDAQLADLRSTGWKLGQGFLFARPMPAADLLVFLADERAGRDAA